MNGDNREGVGVSDAEANRVAVFPDSTVERAISVRRDAGSGALIGYLPVGFPNLETSIEAAITLARAGFDVIELGLPYSDPVMDGPVIQAATLRARENGFRLADGFTAVREIRAEVDVPVVMMTYWNPVMQYGVDRFADDLTAVGGAGLITPDLIPDEGADWLSASERTGLDRIFLAAPSSTDTRLLQAVEKSRGFVYAVSTMGVTGTRNDVDGAAETLVSRLRKQANQRQSGTAYSCVGLGISRPEHVSQILSYADGAIVGSALVRALSEGGISELSDVAASLSAAH
ncbi:tryptophan synthase subunit alpha [Lysinibacter sp. HNR]|uniref:tryptophan synthase subunit alpha n=1 Tax=Lysinibacter sp. HNR TaxID=3031408 RepID=UPI0024358824|nr:tryptophan synthase subunit alpha [Lysinibacter sp. HNR]WGD36351.1 tryptophan synthase subunit alpha [Lysinibacter sp. HNR]